jgi:hypothetical protein
MKKLITAVAAMLLSAAIFAQSTNDAPPPAGGGQQMQRRSPMTPEQRAKRETDNINSLTPLGAAYDKVLQVNTDYNTKRAALRGEGGGQMTDDQKAQAKALNEAHTKDIQNAMGPDLYAKWEAAKKAQREERKQMRMQQQGGGQPASPAPGK